MRVSRNDGVEAGRLRIEIEIVQIVYHVQAAPRQRQGFAIGQIDGPVIDIAANYR